MRASRPALTTLNRPTAATYDHTAAETEIRSLFTAQNSRPAGVDDMPLRAFSAYHRGLIVNDGRTTALIVAQVLEPVRTTVTDAADLSWLATWLDVAPGTLVLYRRVVIQGALSGTVYVVAESAYVPHRLPATVVDALSQGRSDIGTAMAAAMMETRRERLWFGRRAGSAACRAYRIRFNHAPVFAIAEFFR